jgi:hypothetical protein
MYKLISSDSGQNVLRTTDNTYIPLVPANADYQQYLEWLAEGNTPLPPDEPDPWEAIRQKRDQLIRDSGCHR